MSSPREIMAAKYEDYFAGMKAEGVPMNETFGNNATPCWAKLGSGPNGQGAFVETDGMASEAAKYGSTVANALGGIRWIQDL